MSAKARGIGIVLAVLTLVSVGGHAGEPAAKTVSIENLKFQPAMLTVKRGDTVTWKNADLFPHTVTAEGGEFDSNVIAANASFTLTAKKPGEFRYKCTLHPTMQGTLVVK